MEKAYVTYTTKRPGTATLLFKRISDKNSEIMKGKTVEDHREAQHILANVRPIPSTVSEQPVDCDGVKCEWLYRGKGCRGDKVILYIHGGSWAFGNTKTSKAVGVILAQDSNYRVLTVEYRLSPEHKYPASLEDCLTVYHWLREKAGYAGEDIALLGDSAGGNLCLCMLNKLKAEGEDMPACVGCASPVTDMRFDSAVVSSKWDLTYTVYEGKTYDIFSLYLGEEADRNDPCISPVTANLESLPPILIHSGGDEPLVADNEAYAEKAWKQAVDIHLKVWREMFHDFSIVGRTLKESRESLGEFIAFFKKHLQ